MKSLGQLIAHYRKQAGLSQKQLAAAIDIMPNSISLYEANKREPSVAVLQKIAIALRITGDELFGMVRPDIAVQDDYEYNMLQRIRELNDVGRGRLLEYITLLSGSSEFSHSEK